MAKVNVKDFPLIAITEVMDMASGDTAGTVESIMGRKRDDIENENSRSIYNDWKGLDWEQKRPIYIEDRYKLCNGHHRLTKAADVGLLFIHYTDDFRIGWDQQI